jgi:hypothetical protein
MSEYELSEAAKEAALEDINMEHIHDALRLVIELKVIMLADTDCDGGLNATSRRRAWDAVARLGKLLLEQSHD